MSWLNPGMPSAYVGCGCPDRQPTATFGAEAAAEPATASVLLPVLVFGGIAAAFGLVVLSDLFTPDETVRVVVREPVLNVRRTAQKARLEKWKASL